MTNSSQILYCENHPNTETSLRCNRCNKPICPKCAVSTPTGYRCKECVRGQQKIFETAMWYDYLSAFFIAGVLSFVGSWIVTRIGFFTIFLAPIAGVIIAEAVRLLTNKRRSKRLFQVAVAAAVLGCLPALFTVLLTTLPGLFQGGLFLVLGLVWQGFYTVTITTTLYYRLAGIQLRA
jgi:hypothetical protein